MSPSLSTFDLDILAALRIATGSRHALIDSAMPLAAHAPALHDYRLHPQLIAAWLAPLERWLARVSTTARGRRCRPSRVHP
ncbi:hypothetical protein PPMP20_22025 [Paraburkholderia phymatum]|uniref:Uncharacterized protein n=1 Tax=Paraburkholderia phymatum (strain DSM 17167 / CIP 108236 / LMG 21445 / STM815) TaxID=391038 RepID=B2JN17_PARP8|nr:hypothetical protein [Paraburkholderia phymatum]ACC74410.1 hypothetical protein Bphy_5332 [Paraburkholderia phymatum STM815]